MLKKFMAIILLLSALLLYPKSIEILNYENLMMCVNGKSQGEFKPYKNYACYDGVYVSFDNDYNYKKLVESLGCNFVKKEEVDGVVSLYYYTNSSINTKFFFFKSIYT